MPGRLVAPTPGTKLWNVPDRNPRVPLREGGLRSFRRRRQVAISTGAVILSERRSLGLRTLAAATTGVYVVGGKADPLFAEAMLGLLHSGGWRSRPIERTATRAPLPYGGVTSRMARPASTNSPSIRPLAPGTCPGRGRTAAGPRRQRQVPDRPRGHAHVARRLDRLPPGGA